MDGLDDLPSYSGPDGAFSDFYAGPRNDKPQVFFNVGDSTPQQHVVTSNVHFLLRSFRSNLKTASRQSLIKKRTRSDDIVRDGGRRETKLGKRDRAPAADKSLHRKSQQ
mmetsp:Transcript_244/g.776  ORF Transcript_244/g.776 Transcript_244/m.776 type:complete len:109 (-) Transcript_244:1288-1614(-)